MSEEGTKKSKVVSHELELKSKSLKPIEKLKCQKEKTKARQYCVKMEKQFSDNDYTKCEALLQIRPGSRNKGCKNTEKPELNDTDASTDKDPAEKQCLDNLILFSYDDPDDTFLAERINSPLEN